MARAPHNIDLRARTKRLRLGLLFYAVALVAAILLVESSLETSWRALTFFPFHLGGTLVFQAAYGTCPMRALRGERETEFGVERVANPKERMRHRKLARTVFIVATLSAIVATVPLVWLP